MSGSEDCGHRCCEIRTNGYHVHASDPETCMRCSSNVPPRIVALTDQLAGHATAVPATDQRLDDTGSAAITGS